MENAHLGIENTEQLVPCYVFIVDSEKTLEKIVDEMAKKYGATTSNYSGVSSITLFCNASSESGRSYEEIMQYLHSKSEEV